MRKWKFKLVSFKKYFDGARFVRESIYTFKDSVIIQKAILTKGDAMLVFDTTVDWRETHKMLRADFYPTVYSDTVNCDIQFGNVDRSTLEDTPVRKAQFEICAHKYVNVGDGEYGVALLNNCKYGYRAKSGLLSLNLLRSPKYPDPECDMGEHKFSYAFYPYVGAWQDSDLVKRAYCFNNPLVIKENAPKLEALFAVEGNVILETVKVSEDGEGIVVRAYERYGKDCTAGIVPKFVYKEVFESNMLEYDLKAVDCKQLEFGKYEIKTLVFKI